MAPKGHLIANLVFVFLALSALNWLVFVYGLQLPASKQRTSSYFPFRTVQSGSAFQPSTPVESTQFVVTPATTSPIPRTRAPLPRTTVERCVQQGDDSEICFYDGPLCYDGEKVIVFSDTGSQPDKRGSYCYDFRHYEPSLTCLYHEGFGRPRLPSDTPLSYIRDHAAGLADYGRIAPRAWGPLGRGLAIAQEDPAVLTRSGLRARNVSLLWLRAGVLDSVSSLAETEAARATANASGSAAFTNPSEWIGPDAPLASWVKPDATEPDYMEVLPDEGDEASGLYIAGMDPSWLDHTWHGAAALMQLWDVKRLNRTGLGGEAGTSTASGSRRSLDRFTDTVWVDDFAGLHEGPGQPIRPAASWAAPPMDTLLIGGSYRKVTGSYRGMMNWTAQLLTVLTSSTTRFMFNTEWERLGVRANRWVCARRSAVLGYKPRIFTGPADAHAFKLASYASMGIQRNPKEDWPPRRITVVTRGASRIVANLAELLTVIRSFGLPVHWIYNFGAYTAAQQAEIMANTGILVATHGAALANVMYLPAHAVLVELHPYLMHVGMYRELAATIGLFYYSIRSMRPGFEKGWWMYDEPFLRWCDGASWNETSDLFNISMRTDQEKARGQQQEQVMYKGQGVKHVSSAAASLQFECNWRSKNSQLVMDPVELRYIMRQAVDDIGCRDGVCAMGGGRYERLQGGYTKQ